MPSKSRNRRSILTTSDDLDPMNSVSNLFDVAMVFSVALMVSSLASLVACAAAVAVLSQPAPYRLAAHPE